MEKTKREFVLEGQHVFVVPFDESIGRNFAVVIAKKHSDGLTEADDEAILEAVELSKKYSKMLQEKYPGIKGFRYVSLEGGFYVGQALDHFRFVVVPVF